MNVNLFVNIGHRKNVSYYYYNDRQKKSKSAFVFKILNLKFAYLKKN